MKTLNQFNVTDNASDDNVVQSSKGSQDNPYTVSEYEALSDSQEWQGGYVEEVGMVESEAPQTTTVGYGSDIDLTENDNFIGWYEDANCLELSKQILKNYGVTGTCSLSNAVHLTNFNSGSAENGSSNQSEEDFDNAINTIDNHINAGRPIIVGIHYSNGNNTQNGDGTNHFVIITGRQGCNYRFVDCGTSSVSNGCSPDNMLYPNYEERSLVGRRSFDGDGHYVTVTQLRPNM